MNLHRLLRRHFWVLVLNAVSLVAFLHARGVTTILGSQLAPATSLLAALAPATQPKSPAPEGVREVRTAAILARNAFDSVTGPLRDEASGTLSVAAADASTAIADPADAPRCDGVRVVAIAASEDPAWSFASLISREKEAPVMRRRGGELGGKTVTFITSDRVWLTDARGLCQAEMFAPPVAPVEAHVLATPETRVGALARGIHPTSATTFTVERSVVEKVMEHGAELTAGSQVVPETVNGVHGFRFSRVAPGSLLGLVGLQNGDLLETINGFDLTSPEDALIAYARLRLADHLTVTVLRGGRVQNLDYDITP